MTTSEHTPQQQPTIVSAHGGMFPLVCVEPIRMMTSQHGEMEIHEFWQNGGVPMATGFRFKLNGERYARSQDVVLAFPANVKAAIDQL